MKKTAMQLLIEQWNKELQQPLEVLKYRREYCSEDIKEANRMVKELNKRIYQATELLETERQDHERTYIDAFVNSDGTRLKVDFDEYYKDTYQ